ncbi:MAG: hypothetical protein AAFP90_08775, partial [Planctomycetota bacterium]
MEILEDRRMLAAILFHNEGGSALWHDVGNWDLGRLPTDGDDVSIPANIGTVTFDGPDATVDSINALSPLSIQSGLLKSEESLALAAGSSLTVDGPQSVFQSAGPATIDSVNLIVQSGGTIAIADVDSFQQTTAGNVQLRSDGAGSVLSLPGLKTLEGANAYHHNLLVTATEGGEIQLPAMTSQSGAVYFSSTGTDSKIDVPSLESFRGYINGTSSGFHVADNGEIDATSLTSITTGGLHLGTDGIFPTEQLEFFDGGFWGSLRIDQTARDFSSLSTLRHGTLDVNVPGQDFDAITTLEYLTILADVENASVTINNTENYVGGLYGNAQRWDAVAPGSSISMPDLQSIEIQNIWLGTNSVNVNEGGVVSLPNLTTQSGPSYFSSTGADSKIDVSSLESFSGYINGTSSGFHVVDSAEILLGTNANQTQLANADISLDATGTLRGNALRALANVDLTGTGTIDSHVSGSPRIQPGTSIGQINLLDSLLLDAAAQTQIDIGGLQSVTDSDLLSVSGIASLGGTLHLNSLNDFVPQLGDTIVVLTAGSLMGQFDRVVGDNVAPTMKWLPVYESDRVLLRAVDNAGPRVEALDLPKNTQPFDRLTLVFDEPIDRDSLQSNDIAFSGPRGEIAVQQINAIAEDTFELHFAMQFLPGEYLFSLGPNVNDQQGNVGMDQNADGLNASATDAFETAFSLQTQLPPGIPSSPGDGAQVRVYTQTNVSGPTPDRFADLASDPDAIFVSPLIDFPSQSAT